MQIVLCNKYFFLNGGTEKYLADLLEHLPAQGHRPIPFSVRYAGSWPSPFSRYFLAPPGDPHQAHYKDIRLTPKNGLRFLDRSIYSVEARARLSRLLKAFQKTDIAYILQIYNYMSPSILHTFRRHKIPVAMQLGDYNLLCPSYSFLRNGQPCTLCVRGDYANGLHYRCIKRKWLPSAVRVFAMYLHRWLRIFNLVDAFVVPCQFMKAKLVEGGFAEKKIHLLRYPVVLPERKKKTVKKDYILYFGRISFEKGLDTLIRAYQKASPAVSLVLIGRSYDGEKERLRNLIRPAFADKIRFIDFMAPEKLGQWISEALLSVVPSRWYDNAPISIYESFSHATPVIGADIGGIPEQIEEGRTGKRFQPDDIDALAAALVWMLSNRKRLSAMGRAGRAGVEAQSIGRHIEDLSVLFEKTIRDYR